MNIFPPPIAKFLLLLVLLAAACAKEQPAEGMPEEIFTVQYYIFGEPAKDWDIWSAEINKMAAESISTQVNFNKVSFADYRTKLVTLINAAERIDAALILGMMLPYKPNMAKGTFADISQLLPKEAPKLYDIYTPEQWEAVAVDGKIGAVPSFHAYNIGFRWNKQVVDKYGFTDRVAEIRDYEAFEPVLQEYYESSGKAGFANNTRRLFGAYYYYPVLTNQNGPWVVEVNDETKQVQNLYSMPDMQANFRKVREWNLKGWVIGPDNAEAFDGVASGNNPDWLVWLQPHKLDTVYTESFPNRRDGGVINYYSVPSAYPTVLTPSFYHGVMANGDDPTKTLQMMEFIYTDKDMLGTVQWGIKGKSWQEKGGFAELTDTDTASTDYTRHPWEFKIWGNPATTLKLGSPDDLTEQEVEYLSSALVPTIANFSADIKPIRTEVAAIENIVTEYLDQFFYGLRDTDELLAEFQSRLDDAGYEKVRAELQGQIDDWKATQ